MSDNPVSENKLAYYQVVLGLCNSLELLDSLKIDKIKEEFLQYQIENAPSDKDTPGLKSSKKFINPQKSNGFHNDSRTDFEPTLDMTESKSQINLDKEEDAEITRSFSHSQSNFKKKSAEESSAKLKSSGKSVPKYKSISPNKKPTSAQEETRKKAQGQSGTKSSNQVKEKENQEYIESNLEPEKVIEIIRNQFFQEIERVEVIITMALRDIE